MMQAMEPRTNLGEAVPDVANLEAGLAAILGKTATEVDHVECFDEEQRAEIYAILQALRSDTDVHRALVEAIVEKLSRKAANA